MAVSRSVSRLYLAALAIQEALDLMAQEYEFNVWPETEEALAELHGAIQEYQEGHLSGSNDKLS